MATLVTGLGYLGVRLAHDLLDAGDEVIGLENLFSTDEAAVARLGERPGFQLVRGSILNRTAREAAFGAGTIERVYHLAAQASAHPEAAPPAYTEDTNLRGPRLMLDDALAAGVRSFIFASSFRVYGDPLPPSLDEQTPYGRIGDLSHLSKVYVEKLMEMYVGQSSLSCTSVRLAVVYGLGPVMKRDVRFMTVVNKFCQQAARGQRLTVHGAGPLTAFIHLDDACQALRLAAGWEGEPGYRAANAVGEQATILEIARLVAEAGRRRGLEVRGGGEPPGPVPEPVAISSCLDTFGFQPTRTLAEGIEEALDYFLSRPDPGDGPAGVGA